MVELRRLPLVRLQQQVARDLGAPAGVGIGERRDDADEVERRELRPLELGGESAEPLLHDRRALQNNDAGLDAGGFFAHEP